MPGTPITDWTWTFGDGAPVGAGAVPTHEYTVAGVYDVSLTITDAAMNTDNETKTGYIVIGGPTAAFTADVTDGAAPLTVQFTDGSDAGAAPISEWLWDFGDGASSGEPNPDHVYESAGDYTVRLTVTNSVTSDTAVRHQYISVSAGVPPVASFSATPTFGAAPLAVQFTDSSTPGTSPIETWSWDFGDGGERFEPHPLYTYEEPGIYSVSLTVTTDAGVDMLTRTGYITVAAALAGPGLLALALAGLGLALSGACLLTRERPRTPTTCNTP